MEDLSFEEAQRLLDYDPDTGIFRWKLGQGTKCPAGKVAGCVRDTGDILIEVKGRGYRAGRLAFLFMTGRFPLGFITYRDKDRSNNRFTNLLEATAKEVSHTGIVAARIASPITTWPNSDDALLATLWAEGHSASEIGRRMGRSKNSCIGRAHRLGLEPRQSPILSGYVKVVRSHAKTVLKPGIKPADRRPKVERPTNTLQVLSSEKQSPPVPVAEPQMPAIELFRTIARLIPPPPVVPMPIVAEPKHAPRSSCCWPFGEPGTKNFRFCNEPAQPNKPYCNEHCERAYIRVRSRQDEVSV